MRFSESWICTYQCLFINWLHKAFLTLLSHEFYVLLMFYCKWEYHSSMSDRIYAECTIQLDWKLSTSEDN